MSLQNAPFSQNRQNMLLQASIVLNISLIILLMKDDCIYDDLHFVQFGD